MVGYDRTDMVSRLVEMIGRSVGRTGGRREGGGETETQRERKGGEVILKGDYVKAVLYIYPRLGRLAEEYWEHILTSAVRSHLRSETEKAAEYLAEEIFKKEAIERLKARVDGILAKLSEEEKFLLELRYFGRKKNVEAFGRQKSGSERSYYRRQEKLLSKVEGLFAAAGLTEGEFFREYGRFGWITAICRRIGSKEKPGRLEKKWLSEVREGRNEGRNEKESGARRSLRAEKSQSSGS